MGVRWCFCGTRRYIRRRMRPQHALCNEIGNCIGRRLESGQSLNFVRQQFQQQLVFFLKQTFPSFRKRVLNYSRRADISIIVSSCLKSAARCNFFVSKISLEDFDALTCRPCEEVEFVNAAFLVVPLFPRQKEGPFLAICKNCHLNQGG